MPMLTRDEERYLEAAKRIIARNPEAALKFLGAHHTDDKALVSIALTVLLETKRQELAAMQMSLAVSEFVRNCVKEQNHEHV